MIAFIANPAAAQGRLGKNWQKIQQEISIKLNTPSEVTFHLTKEKGHGTRLTRELLKKGAEVIVSVGGDGTLNEVVNGFFENETPINSNAALALFPYGTGGDFRKSIGQEKGLCSLIDALKSNRSRTIDIGKVTFLNDGQRQDHRYFINIASCGLSGDVMHYVNSHSKAFGGALSHAFGTIRTLWKYQPKRVNLEIDGEDAGEQSIQMLAAANGRFFGGGMQVAPKAVLHDGHLDLVIVKNMGLRDFILRGHHVYRGTHLNLPFITYQRCTKLIAKPVDSKERIPLEIDGETPGTLPATFEIIPNAMKVKSFG